MADDSLSFINNPDIIFPSQYFDQDAQNIDAILEINDEHTLEPRPKKPMPMKIIKNKVLSKKKTKPSSLSSSFVIRNERENGKHLIKIIMRTIDNSCEQSKPDVSVQYIVKDNFDDIRDSTERLINKIVNKLSDSSAY